MGKKGIEPTLRMLSKVSSGSVYTLAGGTPTYTGEGWEVLDMNGGTEKVLVWRGYFDLAGYEMEKLTFYLKGAMVTQNQEYIGAPTGTASVEVIDCLSKTPISNSDINNELDDSTSIYSPGFSDSKQTMEQILMCRYTRFYGDQNWTDPSLLQASYSSTWGEGTATAGNRIHITRIVKIQDDSQVTIPQASWQIAGIPDREVEAEYMMRLKRSYELAE